MKRDNIIYWISTALFSLAMTGSAIGYLSSTMFVEAFHHLGFTDSFRVELAVAKLLGVLILLAPLAPRVKEWGYAGFTITMISAIIAHANAGDGMDKISGPTIMLLILLVSYIYNDKRQRATASAA